VEIRTLDTAGWPAAAALLTRAFLDEPYVVEPYGQDRGRREAVLLEHYEADDPTRFEVVLAAYDGALLGLMLGSLPGRCLACSRQIGVVRPDDPEDALEWEFGNNQAAAHATQAEHGSVGKLGVDPDAQGRGVGLALLAAFASDTCATWVASSCCSSASRTGMPSTSGPGTSGRCSSRIRSGRTRA
jgi:GNAT superfamily N-acetyltransferase